jgi:sigma-B regulation protein RsbU (phosphoserine phosphatase)
MLAVAAARVLTADAGADSILIDKAVRQPTNPAEVATRLDRRFAWDSATGQFITLFYGVLNVSSRRFAYVSCGHPPAVRVARDGTPRMLAGSGMPIGLGGQYEQHVEQLDPGDRVFLYTDGVTEARGASGELFDTKRMIAALQSRGDATLQQSVDRLLAQVKQWQGELPARDDISVLGFEVAGG